MGVPVTGAPVNAVGCEVAVVGAGVDVPRGEGGEVGPTDGGTNEGIGAREVG